MKNPNLYLLPAPAAPATTWCGGNLGGDNETCVTTTPLPGVDAFVVGDSKPEGAGHQLRMSGAELDKFATEWVRGRGLPL
ncbi:DUF397 domain-containing protein [Streptomyces sp. NPDC005227]|uniref:DUF397 domain-containing protein n=1 Tax=Streptomyces sp. NPDC005227 TaxID=3364707 RepID=UPI00368384F9